MEIKDLIRGVVKEIVESRIRETDITDGSRVPFGSQEHVIDLEMRIADLERWRDRQRRGSEARANYARLISRLRSELRSANRLANPLAKEDELVEADDDKKRKKRKCTSCGKSFVATPADDLGMCASCGDEPAVSMRETKKRKKKKQLTHVIPPTDMCGESFVAEAGSWVVKHKYDGHTIGFPTANKEKAQSVADARNNVAVNGAWGKNNKGLGAPYEVVPYEPEAVTESVNMKDPEYASIETFVQYLLDDERDTYSHEELTALNFRTRMPVNAVRKELESYGLKLANRPNEKKVRGIS